MIEGLGFLLGTRDRMFHLDAQRPNALSPRRRPRATLTPTLVTRRGEDFMVFGTFRRRLSRSWIVAAMRSSFLVPGHTSSQWRFALTTSTE